MERITGRLTVKCRNILAFSPVVYTHRLAPVVETYSKTFDWYAYTQAWLATCDAMLIVKLSGWDSSIGIKRELNYCLEHSLPYLYADPSLVVAQAKALQTYHVKN